MKEIIKIKIREIKCNFGFHKFSKWENSSRFYDSGIGFGFGWIARLGRKCIYCNKVEEKEPYFRFEQDKLIKEASDKKHNRN